MISLLLVLSLFVTSGVSWALHGVGLTLANETVCGLEEHIHTDECWEEQLVCGFEDDAEHVHTDECLETKLVCGMPEHTHDTGCYTGSMDYSALLGGSSVTFDDAVADAVGIADDPADDYVVDYDEAAGDVLRAPLLRAAGDGHTSSGHYNDQGQYVLDTIDNIAEGIKFTLFDYGGSELESQNNNYGFAQDWDNGGALIGPPYQHNFVSDTGINTGRNATDDILFLAYGTPVPAGAGGAGVEGGSNVYNYWDGDTHIYVPDKNSYSGDYNSNPAYPGNRPVSGIVESDLGADGYPHVAGSGNSLDYLFAPNTNVGSDQSAYKTVYTDVNHLLQKDADTGHLFYNSNESYAYYDQSTGDFIVYGDGPADEEHPEGFKGTFDIINDNHHNPGDTNNIKFDSDGNPVGANQAVTMTLNKATYNVKTNSNGYAVLNIPTSVKPGTYTITASYAGQTIKNTVKVTQVLKLTKVKVKKSAKKLVITATLKKGKTPIKNKKLTFKFNGKKYTAKTNKKGVAKITVKKSVLKKLKVGKKVKYQATYIKDTVTKTVKVKK